jgi:hypothetical protein
MLATHMALGLSVVALLAAAAAFLVAWLALRRAGRTRVRDLRTSVRADVAALQVQLRALQTQIHNAVQSRQRVSSVFGNTAGAKAFQEEADADREELAALTQQLAALEPIAERASYDDMAAKAVTVRAVRTWVDQLVGKYNATLAHDDRDRRFIRDAQLAKVARNFPSPGS